jgi:hypothetical protein
MTRPVLTTILALLLAACAASTEPRLTAAAAEGSAPSQRLWWVGELLFEGPADWKPLVRGDAFTLSEDRPECAKPRFTGLRLRPVEGNRNAGGDCAELFVIVRRAGTRDVAECEEDRRIAVGTYGFFNDAVETTASVGGRPAFRYATSFGQGSERMVAEYTWVCRENDAYVIGIFGPERDAAALGALGELLIRTARWDPPYDATRPRPAAR